MSALLAILAAAPSLSTHAERTQFTETGRYAEVQALCAAFPKAFPGKVKCEPFGTTPLGRPMLAFVAGHDGALNPDVALKKGRTVVLMQGGIHAGEIDGKDAGFWLLRELLEEKALPGVLKKVTVVFVPVFNVDGHERFGTNNRPNQRGPKEMGWRVTSQNLNLNRDYLKAEAPEMQAMLRLLNSWDPLLYVDLHVTDGAQFQHDVSVTFEPSNVGPEGLRSLGKSLQVSLFAELEQKGHLPVSFYPSFIKEDDPSSGFALGWPPPRFANAYWAAHNRYGVLVETHSWKAYAERVRATYDVCVGLVRLAAEDGTRWRKAAREADEADAKRAGTEVVLLYEAKKVSRMIDFKGYAYTRELSSVSGQPWVRYDETTPQVWTVPYFDELAPSLTVKAPSGGWLVGPPYARQVAERLTLHGISFTTLKADRQLDVEAYRLIDPKFRPVPYEGRQVVVSRDGAWEPRSVAFAAGSLFIPAAQARLFLAMHLLDPTGPDSLLAWGVFNSHLEQKEYLEDYLTEAFARRALEDPAIKAAFDARLKDEAFAKDPGARLRFFASKHPSADPMLNVLPVYRVAVVP